MLLELHDNGTFSINGTLHMMNNKTEKGVLVAQSKNNSNHVPQMPQSGILKRLLKLAKKIKQKKAISPKISKRLKSVYDKIVSNCKCRCNKNLKST